MEIIGLVIAIIALLVSVFGIRDVREQVRFLLKVERERAYTKALNETLLGFVTGTVESPLGFSSVHEYSMIERALDGTKTLDGLQGIVMNEALMLAEKLVERNMAQWKPGMNPESAREVVREWQTNKNTAVVNEMLGGRS